MTMKRPKRRLWKKSWRKLKPLSLVTILNDGAKETCTNFTRLASATCMAGFSKEMELEIDFVLFNLSTEGIYWLINKGFIEEDKTQFHKKVMEILQSNWVKEELRFKNQHLNDVGIRSSQISALIDLLIRLGIIDENMVSALTDDKNKDDEEDEEDDC
jgi:hypothetical protein